MLIIITPPHTLPNEERIVNRVLIRTHWNIISELSAPAFGNVLSYTATLN